MDRDSELVGYAFWAAVLLIHALVALPALLAVLGAGVLIGRLM